MVWTLTFAMSGRASRHAGVVPLVNYSVGDLRNYVASDLFVVASRFLFEREFLDKAEASSFAAPRKKLRRTKLCGDDSDFQTKLLQGVSDSEPRHL